MKGCLRVYVCAVCGHQVLIEDGRRTNELCDCMAERIAIQAESREATRSAAP